MTLLKNIFTYMSAITTMVIGSCSTSNQNEPLDPNSIGNNSTVFVGSIAENPSLKFVGSTWKERVQIGIFMQPSKLGLSSINTQSVSNSLYLATQEGIESPFKGYEGQDIIKIPHDGAQVDFIAYAPYSTDISVDGDISMNTKADPNYRIVRSTNLKGCSKKSALSDLNLKFIHITSRLVIELRDSNNKQIGNAQITVSGLYSQARFNVFTGLVTGANTPLELSLAPNKNQYHAGMLPAEYRSQIPVSIKHQGKDYLYSWEHPIVMPGKLYYLVITLTSDGKAVAQKLPLNEAIQNLNDPKFDDNNNFDPNPPVVVPENEFIDGDPSLTEVPRLAGGSNNYFITHRSDGDVTYSLEYDIAKHHSRFVCFTFNSKNSRKAVKRTDLWAWDPKIPATYSTETWFYRSGFDRGHLVASEDRVYSKEANEQTFYYSNMSPQYHDFNAGVWQQLEERVQSWGRDNNFRDTIYVAKGGTITDDGILTTKLKGKMPIPRYYWMALVVKKGNEYKGIAFRADHTKPARVARLSSMAMSIDELEASTGLDLFPNLPDQIENKVESANPLHSPNLWPGI